jgi:predicted Zn-dependent peptidase
VLVVYRVPEYRHSDTPALELLATILGQGESSRLNRSVVRDRKLAQAALSLMNPAGPRRGPGVFLAFGVANSGVAADSVERGLADVFTTIAAEGVTEAELTKAKNSYRSRVILERQQALYKAEALQAANLFLGDPDAVNTAWRRVLDVTAADVKRVAAEYLRPENSLTLLITPEGK